MCRERAAPTWAANFSIWAYAVYVVFFWPLTGLELPAVGVGEQAILNGWWVVAQGCHGRDGFTGHAGLADHLRPAWPPAQQQAEPVADADDDEGGPDQEQRDLEQPAALRKKRPRPSNWALNAWMGEGSWVLRRGGAPRLDLLPCSGG